MLATWWGWGDAASIALAVVLAFFFGYSLTLARWCAAAGRRRAVGIALAADTLSIPVMEIVDNAVILLVPGAMDAGLRPPCSGARSRRARIAFVAAFRSTAG